MIKKGTYIFFFFLILTTLGINNNCFGQASCDPSTPFFVVNLTGKADSSWFSPSIKRNGICCGLNPNANPPIRCVEFLLTLDTNAQGIRFDIASGAIPPGSLGYQINCGPVYQVGQNICLNGAGPHRLTFCKPGNNPNVYNIVSIPKPNVTPPISVSDGCSATLTATGFQLSTIRWTSVPFNSVYNSYLSCTSSCSTVIATYKLGAPPYVDYQVSGIPAGGCNSTMVTRTTRVYFVNDKKVQILPLQPTICYGGSFATITANPTGGAPPYKYLWSNGATTQSINVGVGKFIVQVTDATSCPSAKDSVTVTAFLSPITADAGPDLTGCVNNPSVSINAIVTAAKGGKWTGGKGSFSPSDTSLTVTYTPTNGEINSGNVNLFLTTTGNGSCPPDVDTMKINYVPSPIVNAGADITVCANNNKATLNGSVQNAGGGTWTGGAGTFTPNRNTLNASYVPSAAEISSGSVTLTFTSTGNGSCLPVSDQVKIIITPAPTVNAGIDRVVCANNPTLNLAGSVTIASGGVWSGGTGSFSPSRNALNATYTPSTAEKTAGSVRLTLTTTGMGNCLPVSDDMLITITPAPTVDAGIDRTVCGNNASLPLNGTVTISAGGIWSGGSGSFSPSTSTLNANYTPSAAEITAGKATLTLTSTGNGTCIAVTDQMVITITPSPTANAGPDKTVCANNPSLVMNGTVTNATGGTWTGGTGTFSPNRNSLNIQYTPSPAEISSGSLTLTLLTTGVGNCLPVSDNVLISITPAPIANAGPDANVCASITSVALTGTVNVATGGTWKSSGSGSFSPNANSLTPTYTPSASDKALGNVTLTLTTTGNGNCLPVIDDKIVTLSPIPTSNAGPGQTVCADVTSVNLSGSVTAATGGLWTSNGTGTFTPTASTLNAKYNLSASDKSNGSVKLTLTTTGSAPCSAVSSNMIVTITPAPTVNAGPDKIVCSDISSVSISGSVTVATGGIWSTSGTGSFSPSASSLNAQYIPSIADKASGSVTITLRTTGNGGCIPVQDNMIITLTPAPTINAGSDQQLCSDNPTAIITATKTVASGGSWTGGNGTFTPNRNSLGINYTPTPAEMLAGSVTLTVTSTGNGTCLPVKDDILITYRPSANVSAGPDQSLCGDVTQVQLNGITSNTTSQTWTTSGTGSFIPNTNALNAKYIPSTADTTSHIVTLTLNVTGGPGCNAKSDALIVNFTQLPSIDAGPDQTICIKDLPVKLDASGSPGKWTGGVGAYLPNDTTLNTFYSPSVGEISGGSVTLTITTKTTSTCAPVSDNVTISFVVGPIVDAGPDITVCADTAGIPLLNGTIGYSPGSKWTTSGTGTFLPDDITLNAAYVPSAADISNGKIILTLNSTGSTVCDPVSDDLVLTITPAPTVNAGFDKTICADAGSVSLGGIVTVASGGKWSSSGAGGFNPDDISLNTTYQLTPADTTAHSVTMTLTTTGNGMCKPVSDNVVILITPSPVVSAGKDTAVCKDVNLIKLNGLVSHATGGLWSTSGAGTFSPGPGNTGVDYSPALSDKTSGSVLLTLRSTGNGTCNAVSKSITLSFTPTPTITAGSDQQICADSNWISLSGTVTISTGGKWTSSGTGTFSNPTGLTSNYTLSKADSISGSVVITLTSAGNGTCNPVSDDMILTITPAPIINAGPDKTICADASDVAIFGSVTVATGGIWSTSGTGSFSSSNQLNTTYRPSIVDTANGSITLTITSAGNGLCRAVEDDMTLTIIPAPIAKAITPSPICKDAAKVTLKGFVFNAGGGVWTTSGSGSFSPNPNLLSTDYIPSSVDKSSGLVELVLTTTGIGTCIPTSDKITLVINPAPIVSAGSNQVVCADADSVLLAGDILNAGGGKWTTSGSGSFVPNDSTLHAYYSPSANDTTTGNVTLTLTSTHNGGCVPVIGNINLTITPAPTIKAGPDQLLCMDSPSLSLTSTTTIATGGTWSSNGRGAFSSPDQLNTTYTISSSDTSAVLTFIVTSTGNGSCKAVNDTVKVSFSSIPKITTNQATICADNTGAGLGATVFNASGVKWISKGTGTFSPSSTNINPVYIPSALDFNNSPIKIIVSTTGSGACPSASDSMEITVKPVPIVDAGADKAVCADFPNVSLSGNVQNAGGSIWTATGSGTFSTDPTQLNVTYIPTSKDISIGSVKVYLTTTANGYCNPRQDSMEITITPAPTINAGPNELVCPRETKITTNGAITVSTGGVWSILTGTGTIVKSTSLATDYIFSPSDYTSGTVRLLLTTTGNGLCQALKDTITYTFRPLPTIDAGKDQYVCRNEDVVAIYGLMTVAASARWHTTGTGGFSDAGILLTRYYPSEADKDSGMVKLYVTTDLGATCKQVTDTAVLYLTPLPIAKAGADMIVCMDYDKIKLNGSVIGATGGGWTTLGAGSFAPDTSILSGDYIFAPSDKSAGNVSLTLTTTGNLGCYNIDTVNINIIPVPDIQLPNNPACVGDRVVLNAEPANLNNFPAKYTWYKDGTMLKDSLADITITQTGKYVVRYTLDNCSRLDTSVTVFNPVPVIVMEDRVDFCKENQTATLNAGPGDHYLWLLTGSTKKDTVVSDEGLYFVKITNTFNCSSIDSVKVLDICPPRAFVPTIFSPNNDGHNDHMKVFGKYFKGYKLTVFSRWGEIIFQSEDPNNIWDGTYLGEQMPNGVYPWILYYEGLSESFKGPYKQEGSVTLDR